MTGSRWQPSLSTIYLMHFKKKLSSPTSKFAAKVQPTRSTPSLNSSHFFPKDSFTLILGSDAAANFDKWHKADALKKLVDVLVVRRPSEKSAKSGFPEVEIDALDISATKVREIIESGGDPKEFLTESVLTYIKERGLYGSK